MTEQQQTARDLRAPRRQIEYIIMGGGGVTLNIGSAVQTITTETKIAKDVQRHIERWERFRARWANRDPRKSPLISRMVEIAQEQIRWEIVKAGWDWHNEDVRGWFPHLTPAGKVILIREHRQESIDNRRYRMAFNRAKRGG